MIYTKTALGQEIFLNRNSGISQRARSVLIMIDGKRDKASLLKMLGGINVDEDVLNDLLSSGLIEVLAGSSQSSAGTGASSVSQGASIGGASATSGMSDAEVYKLAYPIAGKLTSGLGLRGFRLNLAVEGVTNLVQLKEIAPKIREAVGDEKYAELKKILGF